MIRAFEVDDTEIIVDIWAKANALAHPFHPPEYVAQVESDLRSIYLPNAETWVVCPSAEPVGFIALSGDEIGGLFLIPEMHGQGFGRALVDHAARLKGPLTVEVFERNTAGMPFYERYGFKRLSEYRHEPTGEIVIRMGMPPGD